MDSIKEEENNKANKVKLTMNTLFAGVGMQERGIRNTGLFDLEVKSISEIDKDAVVSYAAVHCGLTNDMIDNYWDYPPLEQMQKELTEMNIGYVPEKNKPYDWTKKKEKFIRKYWLANKLTHNLGDINQINILPPADLWSFSFPCQSISVAGKLKGLAPDSNTRSSLIWQVVRLLETAKESNTLPKYMLLENVKNLVGKRFIKDFNVLNSIFQEEFEYNVYFIVLNAKNCGVPQNRERVFAVYIRSDIDTGLFEFPKPFDLGIRLKHILDNNVDESYYINTEKADKLIQKLLDTGIIGDDNSLTGRQTDRQTDKELYYRKWLMIHQD